jgi:hypothetical protein
MRIGIMQPYLFPYLGYFQLIGAVDRFVIYDDVNFIKGGWINRNFILGRQGPQRFTLQLSGASPNKLINEVEIGGNAYKLVMTISQAYRKAPQFDEVFPMVEECLLLGEKNLARFLEHALRNVCSYLGLQTEILVSSQLPKNTALRGPDKVIAICRLLGGSTYINAIGGQMLYDKRRFRDEGLELHFLQMGKIRYPQYRGEFVPNLSIVDLMMFNPRPKLLSFLGEFSLV